jgi:site-specific DNA-methyltransferase (adenine-specific)
VHDVILFYAKDVGKHTWNRPYVPLSAKHLASHYRMVDETGRYYEHGELTAPGIRRGRSGLPWRGFEVTAIGRHWTTTVDHLDELYAEGRIYLPQERGWPRLIRYKDESKGRAVGDVLEDIPPINMRAHERIGYPTQKPLALMDRIIRASSNPGDLVLDPFCGCGTTIEAAETAGRRWIGIDIAVHAIKVIEARLPDNIRRNVSYKVEGMPRDFASAVKLAEKDKYQFQWWANYLFNPHALREQKKGADRGVDGELFFPNGPGRPWGRLLTSVKGGDIVGPGMVRDFRGVLNREKAEMGLFICLRRPTQAMRTEAASVGIADTVHGDLPKMQIVSIEEWFAGKLPMLPPLQHLPSAALARTVRRQPPAPRDPRQRELLLPFGDAETDKSIVRHLNLGMITTDPQSQSA